jgi:hypothetical protein
MDHIPRTPMERTMRLAELVLGACVAMVLAIPSPSRGETPFRIPGYEPPIPCDS